MLKDGASLPSSLLHTPLLGTRTPHATGPSSSPGSSGPGSLTVQGNKIKQYSALLQERIPDMWIIAHSFYTGAYHKVRRIKLDPLFISYNFFARTFLKLSAPRLSKDT